MALKKPPLDAPTDTRVATRPPRVDDPDPARRRSALLALGHDELRHGLLRDRLAVETDPMVREVILTLIVKTGDASATGLLTEALRSEDAAVRNSALEALSMMPAVAGPCIEALVHDPDPDVRLFAVNMLGELRHDTVTHWLRDVLLHEREVNIVAAAIDAIAEAGAATDTDAVGGAGRRFPHEPFVTFVSNVAIKRLEAE